jgi:hypothetical protein
VLGHLADTSQQRDAQSRRGIDETATTLAESHARAVRQLVRSQPDYEETK